MSSYSHETAPTRFVEADGIRFAYRRFGKSGELPLLFLQYFNANMDDWDPSVTNGFALDRDVILFDNAGIGSSGGETPSTVLEMTRHVLAFCVVPPVNALILAERLPDAQLVMYPDSSHGAQYQHASLFLKHANLFLDA